jgi:hypothetical protein
MVLDHHWSSTAHTITSLPPTETEGIKATGDALTKVADTVHGGKAAPLVNNFRQYSWTASSPIHKLMRELWRYIQSFEDEHYQIYYKKSVNEETLKDYSSAIQEIIPRLVKVQSVLNHNSRGFPDMMRWLPPTAQAMDTKGALNEGGQDCQEFAIFANNAAKANGQVSNVTAGAIVQSALACQAAASKAAVAVQREKFADPVCDPATVIESGNGMNSLVMVISSELTHRREAGIDFLGDVRTN